MTKRTFASTASMILLSACGGSGSSSLTTTSTSIDSSTAFPGGLAVASPTSVDASASSPSLIRAVTATPSYSGYVQATEQLSGILAGSVTVTTAFDKENFLTTATNANCFGPSLSYSNHPDGAPTAGTLPTGDLGLWTDTDTPSGNACAPAEIDSRVKGVSNRTNQALITLAALIKAAKDTSTAAPTAGTSINLTTALNTTLAGEGITVSSATLALSSDSATWSYVVQMSFTGADTNAHSVNISMQHSPGASSNVYEGLVTYRVDDDWNAGHCATGDRTYNGTVYYHRASSTSMLLNAREGMYCGYGTTGATAAASTVTGGATYLLLDPAMKEINVSTGWSDNFSTLGAQFDPTTTAGKYTYAWQAGNGDGHARIFSIGINYNSGTGLVDGEAYYGFGDDIATSDGKVTGFYCNWAGPGAKTLHNYAQRQAFQYNSGTSIFDVPTGGSDIVYAPRNSCTYQNTDTAGFLYDRNLNNSLADETINTTYVYTAAAPGGFADLDLMTTAGATDVDSSGTIDIFDKMLGRGWVQPPI